MYLVLFIIQHDKSRVLPDNLYFALDRIRGTLNHSML